MSVEFVAPHIIDTIWHLVTDGIENACQKTGGDIDSHYLWTECRSGKATLMIILKDQEIIGASVWRIERWSTGMKCRNLVLYGKNMKEWVDEHYEKTLELANLGHAESLVAEGRPGLARIFPEAKVLRQLYEVRLK